MPVSGDGLHKSEDCLAKDDAWFVRKNRIGGGTAEDIGVVDMRSGNSEQGTLVFKVIMKKIKCLGKGCVKCGRTRLFGSRHLDVGLQSISCICMIATAHVHAAGLMT